MENRLDKLVAWKIILLDPYSLVDGWYDVPFHFPKALYNLQDNFMKHNAGKAFNSGKSLTESECFSGIKSHINTNFRYCFVHGNCCPE